MQLFFQGISIGAIKLIFLFFEDFLSYQEKNPSCSCYWPHCSGYADTVSLGAFIGLEWLAEFSELMKGIKKDKTFSVYLPFISPEEFVRALLVHAYFYSQYHKIFSDLDQFSFKHFSSDEYQKIHNKILETMGGIIPSFQENYTRCLNKHPHPKIYYERGMTYFHDGQFLKSFDDIRQLIDYAEKNNLKDLLNSDIYLKEGKLLNEMLSYDDAIIALTKAIKKDSKNKEAYFERAIAYFETGNFSSAL